MLICPQFHLTWYDGVWPSTEGALVLLGEGDWVEESAALNGMVEQLVQRADYVRGAAPDFWPRGSQTTPLEWTQVITEIPNDGTAIALAMDAAASMPTGPGWILLALPNVNRSWAITPAAVSRIGWTHVPRKNELHLRWSINKGVSTEIFEAPDYAITTETGVALGTEDGLYYFVSEDAA